MSANQIIEVRDIDNFSDIIFNFLERVNSEHNFVISNKFLIFEEMENGRGLVWDRGRKTSSNGISITP